MGSAYRDGQQEATETKNPKERRKKMASIAIKDLEKNMELDKEAMQNLTGGWFWGMSQSTSMGWGYGPWGGGGWYNSSTSMGWGGGWGNPWGGGWGWPGFGY
jgi:hypothetical protein